MDWCRQERVGIGPWFTATNDPEYALSVGFETELGIATPGPSKLAMAQQLQPFWDKAKQELQIAKAVAFVGYRFPPTDAQARAEILGTLRENPHQHLDLHVVLGPGDTADVRRLVALLDSSMLRAGRKRFDDRTASGKTYRVHHHPLFSQDFLSLYDARGLFWS